MMEVRTALGLVPIKGEDMVMHPDSLDNASTLSDERYLRQLQGYKDWAGDKVYKTECSRPELLKRLK